MKLRYKKATEVDWLLIHKLDQCAFGRDFDGGFNSLKQLRKLLQGSTVELIYFNNQPVGYSAFRIDDKKEAEIVGVAIMPAYQKRGIGTSVVKNILPRIKKQAIKVATHPENIAALKLYFKFGFKIRDYKKDYYGKGEHRLVLHKDKETN